MPKTNSGISPQIQKHLYDETNDRFWASSAYKVGQKLDDKDPADAPYIKQWAQIYQTVLGQYNNGTINWTAPIDQEVDARMAAQTGYKPGKTLDPSSKTDAAMLPVRADIKAKVTAQFLNDSIQWTYDHPVVTTNLAVAADASAAAKDHLAAAASSAAAAASSEQAAGAAAAAADESKAAAVAAPTQPEKEHHTKAADAHAADADAHAKDADAHTADAAQHLANAADAVKASHEASKAAASVQPATASPAHVKHAHHTIQNFAMNGAVGMPTGPLHDAADDALGVAHVDAAPAHVEDVAQTAPPQQTAPATPVGQGSTADLGMPPFPSTPSELGNKRGGESKPRGNIGLAIGLGIGAVGLGALAFSAGRKK